jgi:hypothetical protein
MDIAMTYLERAGTLRLFVNAEELVAEEVLGAWSRGVRHKIDLANAGIVAAEKQAGTLPSVFPDVRLARGDWRHAGKRDHNGAGVMNAHF